MPADQYVVPWRPGERGYRLATGGYLLLGMGLLGYLASVLLRRHGAYLPLVDAGLTNVIQIGASLLCLSRALVPGRGRLPALVLGSGLLVWSVGNILWSIESDGGAPPVPSVADWFFLALYLPAYLAIVLLLREDTTVSLPSTWLDGLVSGLGAATVTAAFGFDMILSATGGKPLAVVVNLAYPLGDLGLLALAVAALALPRRRDRRWLLLVGGCALFGVADTTYLFQSAAGTYWQGGLVDAGWPAAIVLMSAAMWAPAGVRTPRAKGTAQLALPVLTCAAALAVLLYGNFQHVSRVALVLATATLVLATVRSLLFVRELRALDVERRLRAEAEEARHRLAEREAENRALASRLAGLLDAAPVGIVETDLDDRVVRWNRAAETIYGWAEMDVVGRPDPNTAADERHQRADGTSIEVEVVRAALHDATGVPVGAIKVVADVTARRRLELELRHAQKLESVGRLAAGVAHEINTPVQFVGDNIRFLRDAFTDLLRLQGLYRLALADRSTVDGLAEAEKEVDVEFLLDEVPPAIAQTLEGVERVATIVSAMKHFGHPTEHGRTAVNVNQVVASTVIVAGGDLTAVAEVRTDLGKVPTIQAHLGDLNQVVFNLLANAADAVAGRDPAVITVSTYTEGAYAVIEVADTGTGIAPDIVDKVFEPFFTTKPVGSGTGQGLALVRSLVVERHGGRVDFTTEPGVGTTFTLRLPLGD